jgi:hypothetical protein
MRLVTASRPLPAFAARRALFTADVRRLWGWAAWAASREGCDGVAARRRTPLRQLTLSNHRAVSTPL